MTRARRVVPIALLAITAGLISMVAIPAASASTAGGTITVSEVLARAQSWVNEGVPYNQGASWTDGNGTYREDCSGFVSMAWHLTSSLVTQTLPNVSTVVTTHVAADASKIQPGDALDYTADHVFLFNQWTNLSNGDFTYYAESNPSQPTHGPTHANIYWSSLEGWPTGNYEDLRYNNIVADAAPAGPAPTPTAPMYAFQAKSEGTLWTYDGHGGNTDTYLGMAPGTSPAITPVPGGYETAFQANTGHLWMTGPTGSWDTGLGMAAGSSPSIASVNGGYEVAFRANGTGNLWVYGSAGQQDTGLGIAPGTNPSITAGTGPGGYGVAFVANQENTLWTWSPAGPADSHLGVASGTSPAITYSGGWVVAFRGAGDGALWTYGPNGASDTYLGVAPNTSPSIAASTSTYTVAFQANGSTDLYEWWPGGQTDTYLGMEGGTSPSLMWGSGGFSAVFAANTGNLATYNGSANVTGLGLWPGTNASAG